MADITSEELPFNVVEKTTPVFLHDSNCDVFLGTEEVDGAVYDLYACCFQPTYIARYGSEGTEYISGKEFVGKSPAITRVYELAKERGLPLWV